MDHMGADRRFAESPGLGPDAPLHGDGASRGKRPELAVIAAALLLLVVAGVSVVVYAFVIDSPPATAELVTPEPAAQAPVAGQEAATAVEPPPVPLNRVFTFRDIFDPLIEPAEEGAAGGGPVPAPADGEAADESTITLQDIESVNGEPAAVLVLGGQTYTLTAGESIPGTPWQVVSISEQTVELLHGDRSVTLAIGQEYTPSVK